MCIMKNLALQMYAKTTWKIVMIIVIMTDDNDDYTYNNAISSTKIV